MNAPFCIEYLSKKWFGAGTHYKQLLKEASDCISIKLSKLEAKTTTNLVILNKTAKGLAKKIEGSLNAYRRESINGKLLDPKVIASFSFVICAIAMRKYLKRSYEMLKSYYKTRHDLINKSGNKMKTIWNISKVDLQKSLNFVKTQLMNLGERIKTNYYKFKAYSHMKAQDFKSFSTVKEKLFSIQASLSNLINYVKDAARGITISSVAQGIETVDSLGRPVAIVQVKTTMALGDLGRTNLDKISNIPEFNKKITDKSQRKEVMESIERNEIGSSFLQIPKARIESMSDIDSSSENEEEQKEILKEPLMWKHALNSTVESSRFKLSGDHLVDKNDFGRVAFSNLKNCWNNNMLRHIRNIYPQLTHVPLHKLSKEEYFVAVYLERSYLKHAAHLKTLNELIEFIDDRMEPAEADEVDIPGVFNNIKNDKEFLASLNGLDRDFVVNTVVKNLLSICEIWLAKNKWFKLCKKVVLAAIAIKSAQRTFHFVKTIYLKTTAVNGPLPEPVHKAIVPVPTIHDSHVRIKNLNVMNWHSILFYGSNSKVIQTNWSNSKIMSGEYCEGKQALDDGTIAQLKRRPACSALHVFRSDIKNLSPVDFIQFSGFNKDYVSKGPLLGEMVYLPNSSGVAPKFGKCILEKSWNTNGFVTERVAVVVTTSNRLHGLSGSALVDSHGKLVGVLTGSFNPMSLFGKLVDLLEIPHDRIVLLKLGNVACSLDLTNRSQDDFGKLNTVFANNFDLPPNKRDAKKATTVKTSAELISNISRGKLSIVKREDLEQVNVTANSTWEFCRRNLSGNFEYFDFQQMREVVSKFRVNRCAKRGQSSRDMPGALSLDADTELKLAINAGSLEEIRSDYHNLDQNFRTSLCIISALGNIKNNGVIIENTDLVVNCSKVSVTWQIILLLVLVYKIATPRSLTVIVGDRYVQELPDIDISKTTDELRYKFSCLLRIFEDTTRFGFLCDTRNIIKVEEKLISMDFATTSDFEGVFECLRLLISNEIFIDTTNKANSLSTFIFEVKRTFKVKLSKLLTFIPTTIEKAVAKFRDSLVDKIKETSIETTKAIKSVLTPKLWFDAEEEVHASAVAILPNNIIQSWLCCIIDFALSRKYDVNWKYSLTLAISETLVRLMRPEEYERLKKPIMAMHVAAAVWNLLNSKDVIPVVNLSLKIISGHKEKSKHWFSTNAFSGSVVAAVASTLVASADFIKEIDYDFIRLSYGDWIFKSDSVRNAGKRAELNTDMFAKVFSGNEKLLSTGPDVTNLMLSLRSGDFNKALLSVVSLAVRRSASLALSGSIFFILRKIYVNYINMDTRAKAVEAMRDSFRRTVEEQRKSLSRLQTLSILAASLLVNNVGCNQLGNFATNIVFPTITSMSILEYYSSGTVNMPVLSSVIVSLLTGRNDLSLVSLVCTSNIFIKDDLYKSAISVPAAVLLSKESLCSEDIRSHTLKENRNVKIGYRADRNVIKGILAQLDQYALSSGVYAPVKPFTKISNFMSFRKEWDRVKEGKTACIKFVEKNNLIDENTKEIKAILDSPKFYADDVEVKDSRTVYYIGHIELPNNKESYGVTPAELAIAPASVKIMQRLGLKDHKGVLLEPRETELALGIRQRAQGSPTHLRIWQSFIHSNQELIIDSVLNLANFLNKLSVKSKTLNKLEKNLQYIDLKSKSTSGIITKIYTGIATIKALDSVMINNGIDETTVLKSLQFMHNMFPKVEVVARKDYKNRFQVIDQFSRKTDDNRIRVIHAAEGLRRLFHRHDNIWFNNCLILSRFVNPVKIGLKTGFEWVACIESDLRYSVSIDISNFDANQHKGLDLLAACVRIATGTDDYELAKGIMLHGFEVSWRVSITGGGNVYVSTGTMASGDVNTSSDNSIRVALTIMMAKDLVGSREPIEFYCQGDNAVIEADNLDVIMKLVTNIDKVVGLPTKIEGVIDRGEEPLIYTPEYLGTVGVKMTVVFKDFKGDTRSLEVVAPWRAPNRVLPKLVCSHSRSGERRLVHITRAKLMCWLITWPLDFNICGVAGALGLKYSDLSSKDVHEYFRSRRAESLKRDERKDEINKGWHHWAAKSLGLLGVAREFVTVRLGWTEKFETYIDKGTEDLACTKYFDSFHCLDESLKDSPSTLEGVNIGTNCDCEDKKQLFYDLEIKKVDFRFCNNDYDNIIECCYKVKEKNRISPGIYSKQVYFRTCEDLKRSHVREY